MMSNSVLLRLEAAVEFGFALWLFQLAGGSWLWFLGLFLLPDVSMVGYVWGKDSGAAVYNLAHNYALAGVAFLVCWWSLGEMPTVLWLVWPAHIAWDRMLGYGLKSPEGFRKTHLSQ